MVDREPDKLARHTQMRQQDPIVVQLDQNVLAAPVDEANARATEFTIKLRRREARSGPCEFQLDGKNSTATDRGAQGTHHVFNFR